MRHTLPNLKNLLLTLTDGDDPRLPLVLSPISNYLLTRTVLYSILRLPNSPVSSTANLPPAVAVIPSLPSDTSSPRQLDTDLIDDSTSSGATTPTAPINDRKSRSLLGLYPLADFLRARYPSVVVRPSVKSVAETPEGDLENGDASAVACPSDEAEGLVDDDDDRRTIRGVDINEEVVQEGKITANGDGVNDGARRPIEKPMHRMTTVLPPPTASTVLSDVH